MERWEKKGRRMWNNQNTLVYYVFILYLWISSFLHIFRKSVEMIISTKFCVFDFGTSVDDKFINFTRLFQELIIVYTWPFFPFNSRRSNKGWQKLTARQKYRPWICNHFSRSKHKKHHRKFLLIWKCQNTVTLYVDWMSTF